MTTDTALEIINRFIAQALEAYNESEESKDSSGNRIAHPLDYIDDGDKLFALDVALKDVALRTTPMSLLESNDSTASELKRVSDKYFVRVPAYPQVGQRLDIDDGLAYAVVFIALGNIWDGFSNFAQKGEAICITYEAAYRAVKNSILNGESSEANVAYIRFSADGQSWHESYQDGDIYISFKRVDTDSWTPAIRFVGQDGKPCSDTQFMALQDTPNSYSGAGGKIVAVKSSEDGVEFIDAPSGGGATKFVELQDTPVNYTNAALKKVRVKSDGSGLEFVEDTFLSQKDTPADYTNAGGKFVAVKSDGSGLEFVDAPNNQITKFGDSATYVDSGSGSYEADLENYNSFWLYPDSDLNITFKTFQDEGVDVQAWFGSTYTFALVSNTSINITFDSSITIYGDATVALGTDSSGTNITLTLIDLYYDGVAFIVKNKTVVRDYNP